MTRNFVALCHYCKEVVYAQDDWANGKICIIGECLECGRIVGEDETDWEEIKD